MMSFGRMSGAALACALFLALPAAARMPAERPQTGQTQTGQTQTGQTAQQEEARQVALAHLNQARDHLAEMTKLPAATKLQGQARTEVNELIKNFNTLITTQGPGWQPHYEAVQRNLNTLLGKNPPKPGATGTTGTTGTTGAGQLELDPELRSKLEAMQQSLDRFADAAGAPKSNQIKPLPGQAETTTGTTTGTTGQQTSGQRPAGTTGTAPLTLDPESVNRMEADLAAIAQILDRTLTDPSASGETLTVPRADLEHMLQRMQQLRDMIKRQPPER